MMILKINNLNQLKSEKYIKIILFSLSLMLLIFSCNVVDPPTGACRWGPLKQNCTETTHDDCKKTFNGDWYGEEHCY